MTRLENKVQITAGNEQQKSKYESAENLRFLATAAVIIVHVSAFSRTSSGLNIDLFYGTISRFCVPVFVMLTGALLLPKSYDLTVFIKNKFIRILIPFMFWGSIYLAHYMYKYIAKSSEFNLEDLLIQFFIFIKGQSDSAPHLWYVYMIFGIYLFIPLIGKAVCAATNQELHFYMLIWFIMLFFEFNSLSYFKTNLDLRYFTGYLGYLILGYYLSSRLKRNFTRIGLLFITLGLSITIGGTYLASLKEGQFNLSFYEYLTPNIAMYSTGIYLLVQRLSTYPLPKSLVKMRTFISSHSYGIYLVHWIILSALNKALILNAKSFLSFLSIPLIASILLLMSGGIIWGIRKVPYGKYISG